jgi:hypothetical protein
VGHFAVDPWRTLPDLWVSQLPRLRSSFQLFFVHAVQVILRKGFPDIKTVRYIAAVIVVI